MKLSHSEQARINGAKSKGPTSPAGKAISSANSLKHGFAAVINVVLRIEDKAAFDLHLEGLRASYKPTDYAEQTFVDQLAAISWRQSRLTGLETALFDAQMDLQLDHVNKISPDAALDPYFHLVQAWKALARQPQKPDPDIPQDPSLPPGGYDINSLELLRRYQTSLDRQFRNTLLNLQQYRKNFATTLGNAQTGPNPTGQDEPRPAPPQPPQSSENRPTPTPIRPFTLIKPAPKRLLDPPLPENKL